MARKKINPASITVDNNTEPTRYYGCVRCGHLADYGKVRHKKLTCQNCGYDDITTYDIDEYKERCIQKGI